ncbi:lipopolysaccharide biosynthesis protein [Alkalimarinus coralli]|uniref:lipopolysaccharide biosynthesis protein n=1 Tax=Alkalimarinus coralli TaxID=2935863 RepID=UPI00202B5A23|nr:hypothetical protein [Alkalimarinus coralli]
MLKKHLINIFSLWFSRFGKVLATIVLTPLILNVLGVESAAIWVLISQVLGFMTLMELGLVTASTKLIAKGLHSPDVDNQLSIAVTTVFALLSTLAILFMIVTSLFAAYGAELFNLQPHSHEQFRSLLLLGGVCYSISFPFRIGFGLLGAKNLFYRVAFWQACPVVIQLLAVLALWGMGLFSLYYLALITFGTYLFVSVLQFLDGWRHFPGLSFSFFQLNPNRIKEVLSVGGASFLISAGASIVFLGSPLIVASSVNLEKLVVFSYAMLITRSILPFLSIGSRLIMPVAVELKEKSDEIALKNVFFDSARYSLALGAGIVIIFLYSLEDLLFIWLSDNELGREELKDMSTYTISIFCATVISLPSVLGRSVLIAVNRHWLASLFEVGSVIIGISFGSALCLMGYGANGMVVGIVAVYFIKGLLFFPSLLSHIFGMQYVKLILCVYKKPLALFLMVTFLSWGVTATFDNIFYQVVYNSIIITLFWCIIFSLLIITASHKKQVKRYFLNKFVSRH